MKHRILSILPNLLFLAIALSLTALFAQTESSKPASAPPADSAEVQSQVASVQQRLPSLPDRAAGLYYLSTSKQHLGQTQEALRLLKECVGLGEGFEPAGSPNLASLQGNAQFDELVLQVHRDFPAVDQASIAFVTTEKGLLPEGLAYDPKQNLFYLSSLNRRKIVKITSDGKVADFAPVGHDALLPVLGIRPDPGSGTVWAASWDEDTDRAELLHFDQSGNLLGRYAPPGSTKHGFNDLVLRNNGEVLLTDSFSNQVLRFDPASTLFSPLRVHRTLSAPNGIALAANNRQLYVADDFGVVVIDLETGKSVDLNAGPHNTVAGIDGLYWRNGTLVAVQNGIGSPRIALFRLSKTGSQVLQTTILENRPPFNFLPTTGAIRGHDFYFIINSQADNQDNGHIQDPSRAETTRIGVLRLPDA